MDTTTIAHIFDNLNRADKDDATWEILLMLFGAFLLGLITCWLLCRIMHGPGHTAKSKSSTKSTSRSSSTTTHAAASSTVATKATTKRKAPATKKKTVATKATARPKKAVAAAPRRRADDLTRIEGVGPKIKKLLHNADVKTFEDLSNASQAKLKSVLEDAGPRFQMHDPGSWPRQAKLAANKNWDELNRLQDRLKGGR